MDCGKEISSRLVVARCDGAVLLEFAIEILDEMALFIDILVIIALVFPVTFGRDHRRFSCGRERLEHALVGVEGFVRQQSIGRHLRQHRVGAV